MTCFIGNQVVDCAVWDAQHNNIRGSQFWLTEDYTGIEPDLTTKALYSTADYARDWVEINLPGLKDYPTPSQQSSQLFQAAVIALDTDTPPVIPNSALGSINSIGDTISNFFAGGAGNVSLIAIAAVGITAILLGGKK